MHSRGDDTRTASVRHNPHPCPCHPSWAFIPDSQSKATLLTLEFQPLSLLILLSRLIHFLLGPGVPKGKEGKGKKESGVRKCEKVKATSRRRRREVAKQKGRRDWVSEPFHSSWMFRPSPLSQTRTEEQAITTEAASHCVDNGDSTLKTGKSEAADLAGRRGVCGW